jgi:serine/threonine protein kinase
MVIGGSSLLLLHASVIKFWALHPNTKEVYTL